MKDKHMGVISSLDMRRPKIKALYVLLFVIILLISLVAFIPPLWVIVRSLEPVQDFYAAHPSLVPHHLEFGKVLTVWKENNFLQFYLNSAIYTAGALVVGILFSALFGYVLSRLKPTGSKFVLTLIIWTMMVPTTTAMVPVYQNIIHFPVLRVDMINSFVPLWLMAGASPFAVIVFKSFFDGISIDLLEAARLDGCSNMGVFARIIMPLSRPVVFTLSIFSVMGSWSDFFWPYLILQKPSLQTVMIGVYNMSGLPADQQFVGVTLAMVPMIIVFLFLQKYIMGGLTIGGIKG